MQIRSNFVATTMVLKRILLQAQRLSALASSQIQDAYDSAGHGSNIRKRKLAEASNALTQQIGEVLAEGHEFSEKPTAQVQLLAYPQCQGF